MTQQKQKNIRVNLSLDPDFYELLEKGARVNYLHVSTWAKVLLKRMILENHNGSENINQEKT